MSSGFSHPGAPEVRLGALADGGLAPALRISGALPDLVALLMAPLLGGVPSPIDSCGRAALGLFASRRVRIDGGLGLMRRFLGVIRR